MIDDRPHRLDRHGQVDRRGDVRRRRRAGVRRRRRGPPAAGAGRARWSRRSRRRFPARPAPTASIAPRSARACSATPTALEAARGDRPSRGRRGARRVPRTRMPTRRWSCSTSRCCSKPAATRAVDVIVVVSAAADDAARARARPAGHDRGNVSPRSSRARCPTPKSARAPTSSSPTDGPMDRNPRRGASRHRLPGGAAKTDNRINARDRLRHRNHRPQPSPAATGWSRSAASRWSTGSRPAAPSTPISIPSGRCRPRRSGPRPVATPSCRTSRASTRRCEELLDFIGDAPLVAHNASFDFGFLNGELGACGRADRLRSTRMVDTLAIARQRHPGAKHTSTRCARATASIAATASLHGALLDAQLLAPGLCRADRRPPDRARRWSATSEVAMPVLDADPRAAHAAADAPFRGERGGTCAPRRVRREVEESALGGRRVRLTRDAGRA